MKKIIQKLLLFSFFPLAILIGVNFYIDPAHLFSNNNKYERQIATYLNQGLNVTNVSNMDERMLQKFFIEGMKSSPDVIVFGSSNAMYIDADFFPRMKFINNAVSSATLNDFLAIYDIYEKKGFKPKKVILGICPYMLDETYHAFWTSLEDNYYSMMKKIGLDSVKEKISNTEVEKNKWKELVSLSYFQQSTTNLFGNFTITPTKNQFSSGSTRVVDGSFNNGNFYNKKSKADIENTVKRLINKPDTDLENLKSLNRLSCLKYEKFIDYLKSQGIEVTLYLMVYHPIYYDYISVKYPILETSQNYLLTVAEEKNMPIVGNNDPNKCGVLKEDFTDYSHLFKNGLLKIFNRK